MYQTFIALWPNYPYVEKKDFNQLDESIEPSIVKLCQRLQTMIGQKQTTLWSLMAGLDDLQSDEALLAAKLWLNHFETHLVHDQNNLNTFKLMDGLLLEPVIFVAFVVFSLKMGLLIDDLYAYGFFNRYLEQYLFDIAFVQETYGLIDKLLLSQNLPTIPLRSFVNEIPAKHQAFKNIALSGERIHEMKACDLSFFEFHHLNITLSSENFKYWFQVFGEQFIFQLLIRPNQINHFVQVKYLCQGLIQEVNVCYFYTLLHEQFRGHELDLITSFAFNHFSAQQMIHLLDDKIVHFYQLYEKSSFFFTNKVLWEWLKNNELSIVDIACLEDILKSSASSRVIKLIASKLFDVCYKHATDYVFSDDIRALIKYHMGPEIKKILYKNQAELTSFLSQSLKHEAEPEALKDFFLQQEKKLYFLMQFSSYLVLPFNLDTWQKFILAFFLEENIFDLPRVQLLFERHFYQGITTEEKLEQWKGALLYCLKIAKNSEQICNLAYHLMEQFSLDISDINQVLDVNFQQEIFHHALHHPFFEYFLKKSNDFERLLFLKNKEFLKKIYETDENQPIRLLIQRYVPISYLFTRLAYGNQKFIIHFVKHPRAFKNTLELWQSQEIIDFEMQHDIFLLLKNQLDLLALLLNKISNQDLVDYLLNPEYLKHYFLTPSVLYLLLQYLTPRQRWDALFNFYQTYPNEFIWLFKKTSHQQFKNFTELLVDDDYFHLFKILYVHHQEEMFIRSLNEYKHFALALSLLTLEQRFSLVHELPQILSLIQRQPKYLSQAIAGMDYEMLCVWLTAGPNILSLQQGNTSYLQLFLNALDEKERPQFIQETKLIEENMAYPESLKMLFDMLSTEFLFESLLAMDSHYQIPLVFRLLEKPALFKNVFNRFCTDKKTLLIEKTDAQGQTIFFWTYHAQTLELLLACIPLSQRFDYITHKNHQGFNLLKGFLYLPKALRSVFAMIPSERHQDLLNSHVGDETTLAQTLLNYPKSMKSSFEIVAWDIQKSWLMSHDALFVFLEKPSYLSWWLTRIPEEDALELLEQVNSEGKTLLFKAFEYPLAVVILMQNLPYALFKEKIINLYAQGFDVLHQLALKGGLLPVLQQLNTKDALFFLKIKNQQDISLWELLVEDFDDLRKFIRCIMPTQRFELFTQEHQNQPLIKKQLPHLSEILGWIAPKQKNLFLMHRYQNYPSVFWLAEDALSCLSWLELLEQSHRLHILLQENEEGVSLFDKMFSSDIHVLEVFNLLTPDVQIQLLNSKRALLYQYPQKSASILQQQLLSHLEILKTIHPEPSFFSWRFFCYAHPLYREIKSHLDELQQGKNLESILESILGMNEECSGPNLIR